MLISLNVRKRLFLLFSHSLTAEQGRDAQQNMNIREIIPLPPNLQTVWSDVPVQCKDLGGYAQHLFAWLEACANQGDYVLIQGETGLVYLAVQYCNHLGLIPIYATTNRVHQEKVLANGKVVSTRIFKHEGFRKFPTL